MNKELAQAEHTFIPNENGVTVTTSTAIKKIDKVRQHKFER